MEGSLVYSLRQSSSLATLDLGEICLQKNTLRSLLEMTKNLEILECRVPNAEQTVNPKGYYIQISLTPADIINVIVPIQRTLTKLVLNDVSPNCRPTNDGSRQDLSGFTTLKIIKIPSNLLFQALEVHLLEMEFSDSCLNRWNGSRYV